MSAAEVLASLESDGVTVTFDPPTGQLHVRPRPVPATAAELIRAHRELLVGFLSHACSRYGATDAPYLVPAHWDESLAFCHECCVELDRAGEIPDEVPCEPSSDNAEAGPSEGR
jgi:hypothetical protein